MDNCITYTQNPNYPCKDTTFENFQDPQQFKPSSFYDQINNEPFNTFKFPEDYINQKTQENYELQNQQMFVPKYANFHNNTEGLLIYHNLGSGKTCTSILVGEAYKAYYENIGKRILVVLPPATVEQFREELKGKIIRDQYTGCVSNLKDVRYIPEQVVSIKKKSFAGILENLNVFSQEKNLTTSQNKKIEQEIDKYWEITTHIKFINNLAHPKDEDNLRKYVKRLQKGGNLVIIDEIQNLISESGVLYKKLLRAVRLFSQNNKFIVLSATPIYDKPFEIGLTINLLNPRVNFPITQKGFENLFYDDQGQFTNKNLFKRMCNGYVSYFSGGNPKNFPNKRIITMNHTINYNHLKAYTILLASELKLSKKKDQLHTLKSNKKVEEKLDQNYLSKTRALCNIAYPSDYNEEKETPKEKIKNMEKQLKEFSGPNEVLQQVSEMYSTKIAEIVRMATESKGTVLIFSDLVYYGVRPISIILKQLGYLELKTVDQIKEANKRENKRFTEWSGENINATTKKEYSTKIRELFNSFKNKDGRYLKIILGTTSIMEGISFKNVRDVHIVNPWWNDSRIKQVIARAIRYKSHIELKPEEQFVNVYKHYSVLTQGSENFMKGIIREKYSQDIVQQKISMIGARGLFKKTIDEYIQQKSDEKQKIVRDFELALKASAVDCGLNKHGNIVRKVELVEKNERNQWEVRLENPSNGDVSDVVASYTELKTFTEKKTNEQSNVNYENMIIKEGIDCFDEDLYEEPDEYKQLVQETKNYHNNSPLISKLFSGTKTFLTMEEEKKLRKEFIKVLRNNEELQSMIKVERTNKEKIDSILTIISKSVNVTKNVLYDVLILNKKIPYSEIEEEKEKVTDMFNNAKRLYVLLDELDEQELQNF